MSNPDILSKSDKVLRPVLKELGSFSWLRVEACCAGHKPEDSLWLDISVLGSSGLGRLMDMLRTLEGKLADTDIQVECVLDFSAELEQLAPQPHGWIPTIVEIFWLTSGDWRRSQSMIIETMLSSLEELKSRTTESDRPQCAINYCPFCSSSFIRLDSIGTPDHRYRCGDCDMVWTMIDPVV